MKLFAYNPTTGTRGELLDTVARGTWCDCSVNHAIKTGVIKDMGWVSPRSNEAVEHTMHIDGGYMDTSYQRDEQWVTYCIGECRFGNEPPVWQWVILPSKKDMELATIK